jgi:hypothetical protein
MHHNLRNSAQRESVHISEGRHPNTVNHMLLGKLDDDVHAQSQRNYNNKEKKRQYFIRAILYNQIPLTAFFSWRIILACLALFSIQVMVSFVFPFFSLVLNKMTVTISIYIGSALICYILAILVGNCIVKAYNTQRIIIFLSLLLASGSCYIFSWSKTHSEIILETSIVLNWPPLSYLGLSLSAGFLTSASFKEIQQDI